MTLMPCIPECYQHTTNNWCHDEYIRWSWHGSLWYAKMKQYHWGRSTVRGLLLSRKRFAWSVLPTGQQEFGLTARVASVRTRRHHRMGYEYGQSSGKPCQYLRAHYLPCTQFMPEFMKSTMSTVQSQLPYTWYPTIHPTSSTSVLLRLNEIFHAVSLARCCSIHALYV